MVTDYYWLIRNIKDWKSAKELYNYYNDLMLPCAIFQSNFDDTYIVVALAADNIHLEAPVRNLVESYMDNPYEPYRLNECFTYHALIMYNEPFRRTIELVYEKVLI